MKALVQTVLVLAVSSSANAQVGPRIAAHSWEFGALVDVQGVQLTHLETGAKRRFTDDVPYIRFVDRTISFDTEGTSGKLYRLYQAAFGRPSDADGLGFWIHVSNSGVSHLDISRGFLSSNEFKDRFGSKPTPEAYVSALYANVLNRAPDAAGYAWWVQAVTNGADPATVLLQFAESKENIDGVQPRIANGIEYAQFGLTQISTLPTSYENKHGIGLTETAMPGLGDPSMERLRSQLHADKSFLGFNPRSLALGDFLGDGTISMFVSGSRFTNAYPNDNPLKWGDSPSDALFLRKGSDGQWENVTATLVPEASERSTCVTNSYTLIADFNNDGRPDLYLSCTGIDFTVGNVWTDEQASEQFVYLSQPNGTYRKHTLPFGRVYGHQATAADFNGDGNTDVVTVDPVIRKKPFVLWGNGDGTFRLDDTVMPENTHGKDIYGAVAIRIEGRTTLLLSGLTPGSWPANSSAHFDRVAYGTRMLQYNDGKFVEVKDLTATIPKAPTGAVYSSALDHVYQSGILFSLRSDFDYSYQAVTRTELVTGATTIVFETKNDEFGKMFDQLGSVNGSIRQYGAICNLYDATHKFVCSYQIPIQ
jgi:hypothetical protein